MNNDRRLDIIAQFLRDNDQTTFTFAEAQEWSAENGWSEERPSNVIQGLKARGFLMVDRKTPKKFRTLSSNPHDRWTASPTFGGGGHGAIYGMAGQEGSPSMTDLQRKLWLAWIEADKAMISLAAEKNDFPSGTHSDVLYEWRMDFHKAIGHRDGLRAACIIAEVPNFKE